MKLANLKLVSFFVLFFFDFEAWFFSMNKLLFKLKKRLYYQSLLKCLFIKINLSLSSLLLFSKLLNYEKLIKELDLLY